MAFTTKEKEYAEIYLAYYSGGGPVNSTADKTKIEEFVYGTETQQRAILNTFLKDIFLPQQQVRKASLDNAVTEATNLITELQNYTK